MLQLREAEPALPGSEGGKRVNALTEGRRNPSKKVIFIAFKDISRRKQAQRVIGVVDQQYLLK